MNVTPYIFPGLPPEVAEQLTAKRQQPTLEQLLDACCKASGVTLEEVMGSSRLRTVVDCRKLFCYLATRDRSDTLATIGRLIGVNHATVLHHRKDAKKLLEVKDPSFTRIYRSACSNLV